MIVNVLNIKRVRKCPLLVHDLIDYDTTFERAFDLWLNYLKEYYSYSRVAWLEEPSAV